jgi:transposase InsO family protein
MDLCRLSSTELKTVARRSDVRQPRRQLEYAVRAHVVSFSLHALQEHRTLADVADLLRLSARTLRKWQSDFAGRSPEVVVLGRPLERASASQRNEVIALLDELGPAVGVPTLQECFPLLARAELVDLLRRYRRVWQKQHPSASYRLRWPVPGRVWAMDFAEAPAPIDGLDPYLLAVRDLASGQQLAWTPMPDLGAAGVEKVLSGLFALHGAPLVLKMDNGSAFLAELTWRLLHAHRVLPLFSPPYTPRYNGAIEAGIGSLKTRTETHAAHLGLPGFWSADDVAAARLEANATARPRGPRGPTPEAL